MPDKAVSFPSRVAATSRTTAVMDAVRTALEGRREMLDRADDLCTVSVVVRLHAGTMTVKSVVCSDERAHPRLGR